MREIKCLPYLPNGTPIPLHPPIVVPITFLRLLVALHGFQLPINLLPRGRIVLTMKTKTKTKTKTRLPYIVEMTKLQLKAMVRLLSTWMKEKDNYDSRVALVHHRTKLKLKATVRLLSTWMKEKDDYNSRVAFVHHRVSHNRRQKKLTLAQISMDGTHIRYRPIQTVIRHCLAKLASFC